MLLSLVLSILLLGSAYASSATLWDFMVKAEFEAPHIEINEKPVILGTVLDHASKPVSDAQVKIRFSTTAANTTTDSAGKFRVELPQQQIPGLFSVTVHVVKNNQKGFTTTTLRVGSELSSFDEIYYKNAAQNNTKDNIPNSHQILKLKNYEKFLSQQNKKLQKQIDVAVKKQILEEKRAASAVQLQKDIMEKGVAAGIYGEKAQHQYLSRLNPAAKDNIAQQLNFTKQVYQQAKDAMKSVLDNGGSLEDARKAYYAKLAVSKEELIKINQQANKENQSKTKSTDHKINSKKVKGLKLNAYLK